MIVKNLTIGLHLFHFTPTLVCLKQKLFVFAKQWAGRVRGAVSGHLQISNFELNRYAPCALGQGKLLSEAKVSFSEKLNTGIYHIWFIESTPILANFL